MAHNTFVLEVTGHDGKTKLHGLGVGGVPHISAEQVAEHFSRVNHFQGKAKKVKILHRSHIVRKTLENIHEVKNKDLPPVMPEVEIHDDANKTDPELDKGEPPKPDVLSQKSGNPAPVVKTETQPPPVVTEVAEEAKNEAQE